MKWPELQIIAPSFMRSEVLAADDVAVAGDGDEHVADGAASAIGLTWKPSIAASRARIGSTSVTMTVLPSPRARRATPLPHQP